MPTDLTAVSSLPHSVNRCKEAVPGHHKLSMAAVWWWQFHLKGAIHQGRGCIAELQPQLGTCVAGAIVTDDIVQCSHTGRLYLSHLLPPCAGLHDQPGLIWYKSGDTVCVRVPRTASAYQWNLYNPCSKMPARQICKHVSTGARARSHQMHKGTDK